MFLNNDSYIESEIKSFFFFLFDNWFAFVKGDGQGLALDSKFNCVRLILREIGERERLLQIDNGEYERTVLGDKGELA